MDKTERIHRLITKGVAFFLSRPWLEERNAVVQIILILLSMMMK